MSRRPPPRQHPQLATWKLLPTAITLWGATACHPHAPCAVRQEANIDESACVERAFATHARNDSIAYFSVKGDAFRRMSCHYNHRDCRPWTIDLVDGRIRPSLPEMPQPIQQAALHYNAWRLTRVEACDVTMADNAIGDDLPVHPVSFKLANCPTAPKSTELMTAGHDPSSSLAAVLRGDREPAVFELYETNGHLARELPLPSAIRLPAHVQVLRHTLLVRSVVDHRQLLVDSKTGSVLSDITPLRAQPFQLQDDVFTFVGGNELQTVNVRTGQTLGRLRPIAPELRAADPKRPLVTFTVRRPEHPEQLLVSYEQTLEGSQFSFGNVAVVEALPASTPRRLRHLRPALCPVVLP